MFKMNYQKPGPGLPEKRDPNQSRMSVFFEILGERFWDVVKLNLLFVLFSIPAFIVTSSITGVLTAYIMGPMLAGGISISSDVLSFANLFLNVFFAFGFTSLFGLGPSTAGLTYALRNLSREQHVWLISDFWQRTKENFKQALGLWILNLVLFCLIVFAMNFYAAMGGAISYLRYVLVFFILVYTFIHLFVYQLMITFKLPLKHLIKNAFILSIANAPKSLLLLLITVLVHIVLPFIAIANISSAFVVVIYFALEILILPSLTAFITNFFIYPIIEKYIEIAKENEK